MVGLGSIGRRHVENLRLLDPSMRIAVWRHQMDTSRQMQAMPDLNGIVYCLDDALRWQPDVALLTNPAPLHVPVGLALARQGVHLFIEKPLSDRLDGVDELLGWCHDNSLVLMVGYMFRFSKALLVMKQAVEEHAIGRLVGLRAEVGQYLASKVAMTLCLHHNL